MTGTGIGDIAGARAGAIVWARCMVPGRYNGWWINGHVDPTQQFNLKHTGC